MFSKLYARMLFWSQHRWAPYYLAAVSFIESSIFPIPPDVMLAPMTLAKPEKAWRYATITTGMSVLGALFGYLIGMYFFHWIYPMLSHMGYASDFHKVQTWFGHWGGWVLFVAGISPIPFKLFTIAGGTLHTALLPFVIGSIIGRGVRFYLEAGLIRWGGPHIDRVLKKCIDWLGWVIIAILIVAYGTYRWLA